jgi:hypothetical protein
MQLAFALTERNANAERAWVTVGAADLPGEAHSPDRPVL